MATKKSFESELEKLEKITEELESGEISLENSLKKFNEGLKCVAYCSKQLNDAKVEIENLREKDGKTEATPFADDAENGIKSENGRGY